MGWRRLLLLLACSTAVLYLSPSATEQFTGRVPRTQGQRLGRLRRQPSVQRGPYKTGGSGVGAAGDGQIHYDLLSKEQLKGLLKQRGMKISGSKAELVNRLRDFSRQGQVEHDEDWEAWSENYGDEDIEGLEDCTVPQLKKRLKARGLDTTGDKDELVDRLWADYYHRHYAAPQAPVQREGRELYDLDFD